MPTFLARLQHDCRDGLRQLRTARVHSILLILILATGLAAAVAIFTVVRGVILRPLPFVGADRLVTLQEYQPARRRDQASFSAADLTDYRAAAQSVDGLAGFSYSEFVLSGDGLAERAIGATVDAGVFPLLGARPLHGRFVNPGEDGEAPAHVVVLSFSLWIRRYASDSTIVGRSITLNGESYTVIGITPPQFEFPRNAMMDRNVDLWTPSARSRMALNQRGIRTLTVLGRLRPGVTLAAAQSELTGIATRLGQTWSQTNNGWTVRVVSLRDMMVGRVRSTLLMLAICVIGLLCIVSVNAAAAILARTSTRTHGLAVRLALGASRWSIGELLISESIVLALIAGLLSLPMGAMLRRILVAAAPVVLPRLDGVGVDLLTGVVTVGVALAIGIAAAIGPAWYLARVDPRTFLADANRSSSGSRGLRRTLSSLVVVQLTIATVLLGATARASATYRQLNRVDPGFRANDVLTGSIALPGVRYATATARMDLTERYVDRVRRLPGVTHAAVTSLLPMSGGMMSTTYTLVGGDVADTLVTAALRSVSSDFFQTIGIPVRVGRSFGPDDDGRVPFVAIVNQAFVRQSLSTAQAVGRSIRVAAPGMDSVANFLVVGVAGDAREKDLTLPPTPIIYFSNRQVSFPHAVLAVRSNGSVTGAALRSTLATIDPSLALDEISTLQEKVRATYALPIFLLKVLAVFAIFAVTLAAVGVYASVSFAVAAESRAMGIRLALGATRFRILRLVIGRSVGLAVAGCGAGIVILAVGGRTLPIVTQGGGAVGIVDAELGAAALLLVAAVAGYLPARRASRADPVAVLHG